MEDTPSDYGGDVIDCNRWVYSEDQFANHWIKNALTLVDIRVLDHISVGDTCYSFAESRELMTSGGNQWRLYVFICRFYQ